MLQKHVVFLCRNKLSLNIRKYPFPQLTESGLSIVDWRLIKGMKPPTTEQEWLAEFEKYKYFPEYHMKNGLSAESMTLEEFKFIFYMEYVHRMWGRFIGLAYLLPAGFFWYKGWFEKSMKKRVTFAGSLLIFQGLLGWYMVKSGLDPSNNSESEVARVSHYRLASHLTTAFVLYTVLLWSGLSHLVRPINYDKIPKIGALRGMTHFAKTGLLATAVYGAFVAGLDAGLVHGTWPKYTGRWIPTDIWSPGMGWRNLTENPTTVQFIHRNLAYISVAAVTGIWLLGRRIPLAARTKNLLRAATIVSYAQVIIGIAALIHDIPVYVAALHQNNFMIVLSLIFWFAHDIRRFPIKFLR
uniref:Uncharacterized protein n=1 Tax=Romanomermis culicivorax TaxID=13658 RepID=A0A915JAR4_ROMCU